MATVKEYFDKDLLHVMTFSSSLWFNDSLENKREIRTRVHFDVDARVKYISFYVPHYPHALLVLEDVLAKLPKLAFDLEDHMGQATAGMVGEKGTDTRDLEFSGRVFFYSEDPVDRDRLEAISKTAAERRLFVQYRGPEYAAARSALEKPVAFICHDTRDKDAVARPIALGLEKRMCWVWFDEYSLNVGDSLRESIERGIKECNRCILVISKHFLGNSGWTKREFDSIFTRELLEKKRLVLPVWHDVTAQAVYEYSPSLLDVYALNWEMGEDEVVRKLHSVLAQAS
jgi:TIR domain